LGWLGKPWRFRVPRLLNSLGKYLEAFTPHVSILPNHPATASRLALPCLRHNLVKAKNSPPTNPVFSLSADLALFLALGKAPGWPPCSLPTFSHNTESFAPKVSFFYKSSFVVILLLPAFPPSDSPRPCPPLYFFFHRLVRQRIVFSRHPFRRVTLMGLRLPILRSLFVS